MQKQYLDNSNKGSLALVVTWPSNDTWREKDKPEMNLLNNMERSKLYKESLKKILVVALG